MMDYFLAAISDKITTNCKVPNQITINAVVVKTVHRVYLVMKNLEKSWNSIFFQGLEKSWKLTPGFGKFIKSHGN